MPERKRESERRAYLGLRKDFSEDQIALALERLFSKGLPSNGGHCHSPFSFLAKAMGEVLKTAQIELERLKRSNDLKLSISAREELRLAEEAQAENETRIRERKFLESFPSAEEQSQLIAMYSTKYPALSVGGPILRNIAIATWWAERQGQAQKTG